MPSYAIIGASRGIGYAFLQHLSKDSSNTMIGTVRKPQPTLEQVKNEGLSNVHILPGDLTSYESLLSAAETTSTLVPDGVLDYLIINGAYLSNISAERFLTEFTSDYATLLQDLHMNLTTNAIGPINAINAFLPLLLKSPIKKVIAISSGMADNDLATQYSIWESTPYAMSKAALNTAIAHYDAKYRKDGVLFLSMCPGAVDTGDKMPPGSELPMKFASYAPNFKGPITPEESVKAMLDVIEKANVNNGFGGAYVSHFGNKQWL